MRNFLSIEKTSREDLLTLLSEARRFKQERWKTNSSVLKGQNWAMLFSKSSTRTRVSFEVGIRELGGEVLFLSANELQLGRGEPVKDTARVLGRMVQGAVIRTFAQKDVEEFAQFAQVPTINALTDEEHPCQILADILTYEERNGSIQGKTVAFAGDGACNVANSWVFAAARLDFELRIAAPKAFQPSREILARVPGAKVMVTSDLQEAARNADIVYTDVWVSMGKESEEAQRVEQLKNYQINRSIAALARPGALIMHCLPAYRGKEIDEATFEENAKTIFDQAENRLHAQKAVLKWIAG